ncbi:MAG: trigger factor [Planctomycetota bacterium]|jgi:trigger factor
MAEATATEKSSPEVKIEEIGPATKRLTITVAPAAIDAKLEEAMGTLAAETALPGFRKGRAPRQLLERRFGSALRTETKNQLIADAYSSAIEEHQIKPVGEPEPVESLDDLELAAGKAMTFSVDVEVVPEFDLPDVEGLKIDKPVLDISEDLVANELKRYQVRLGDVSKVTEGFEAGDRLIGSVRVSKKGEDEPFFDHDQVAVVYPEKGAAGQVLGLLIDDLDKKLAGTKVTDTVEIKTTGPEGHEREDIRGVDLRIEFEIHACERIAPASIEKIVETLGLGTEEILNEQIKLALEQRRDEEQAEAMRQQVRQHLVDAVGFDLPEKLSQRQVARTLEQQRMQMLYQGMTPEEVETRLAEIRTDSAAATQQRLKLFFIVQRLADHFGVEVSQQEINGRVAAMAARRGLRPEKLMQELAQAGRLPEVATQIREMKALDRVVHQADTTELTAEEWRKKHEDGDAAAAAKPKTKKKSSGKKKTSKKTTAKR